MKIAVITHYFPTSNQPHAGHSAYQTLKLLARECELKVFYPETAYLKWLTPPSRVLHSGLDPSYRPAGVDVEYLPYTTFPIVSRPLNGFSGARVVGPHIRAWRPDILLNYVVYPDGYAALRIGRKLGLPVVVTAIGSDLNVIPDPICGMLTRKVMRQADLVLTVSGALRQRAIALGADPARSQAILNGCDTTVFHPRDKAAARQALNIDPGLEAIVYVGRIDLAKGLRELVDAVASLRHRRPRVRCFIVGDGSDEPALAAAIAHHQAGEWIKLVPPCPTDQVALWMAASDLITLPSYREGCPNVILEALASGRPVVASNVGGIPEIMDETCGRLVPAKDSAALATALDQTLAISWDPAAIASLHTRGWAEVAADLRRALEGVLQKKGLPKGVGLIANKF